MGLKSMPTAENGGWRFVGTGPLEGAMNMAVDEALLLSFDPLSSPPVFRVYGWSPPAFSLGRFQDPAAVLDLERCARDGIAVVRRVTGGGAIYHTDEITYSIVCRPDDIAAPRSVKESFRVLTSFLLRFYSLLGLKPEYALDRLPEDRTLGLRTPFCFAGKEAYDIMIGGKKIGGNAQRRLKGVIFQHGSIPVANHAATAVRYLKERPGQLDDVVSLRQLGVTLEEQELKDLLKTAFTGEPGVALKEAGLTVGEKETVRRLLEEKYRESKR